MEKKTDASANTAAKAKTAGRHGQGNTLAFDSKIGAYDANIPQAAARIAVMRDLPNRRKIALRIRGLKDRRCSAITIAPDGCCDSQFAAERLRKLDADIVQIAKALALDTASGARRVAQIDRELETIEPLLDSAKSSKDAAEQAASSAAPRKGDEGVSSDVLEKRRQGRISKSSAAARARIASLDSKKEALEVERAEILEVHGIRERLARDSRDQIVMTYLMEMHVYLSSACGPGTNPPDVSSELGIPLCVEYGGNAC